MTDKFRKTVPLKISFSNGEQPTAAKLTAVSEQLRYGTNLLEYAIGDIWNESGDTLLDSFELQIPNIARMIGQNKLLNPAIYNLGAEFKFYEWFGQRNESQLQAHTVFLPQSAPSLTNPGNILGTIQTNVTLVSHNTNNCYVNLSTGEMFIYHEDGFNSDVLINYIVDPTTWLIGDEFLPSIIPDPRAVTYTRCRISKSGSTFYLHLPPRTRLDISGYEAPSNYPNASEGLSSLNEGAVTDNGTTNPYRMFHPDSGNALNNAFYRYQFPKEIADQIGDLTPITGLLPTGFLYLWDHYTNTIVRDVQFYRSDGASWTLIITSTSTDLDEAVTPDESAENYGANGRYSLITVGASIATTLRTLYKQMTGHTHGNQGDGSPIVQHVSLDAKEPMASDLGLYFSPSYWTQDSHITLLSRSGSSATNPRDMNNNAMMGDLCLASATPTSYGQALHTTDTSNKLLFGDDDTDVSPGIWHNGTDLEFRSLNSFDLANSSNDAQLLINNPNITDSLAGLHVSNFNRLALENQDATSSGFASVYLYTDDSSTKKSAWETGTNSPTTTDMPGGFYVYHEKDITGAAGHGYVLRIKDDGLTGIGDGLITSDIWCTLAVRSAAGTSDLELQGGTTSTSRAEIGFVTVDTNEWFGAWYMGAKGKNNSSQPGNFFLDHYTNISSSTPINKRALTIVDSASSGTYTGMVIGDNPNIGEVWATLEINDGLQTYVDLQCDPGTNSEIFMGFATVNGASWSGAFSMGLFSSNNSANPGTFGIYHTALNNGTTINTSDRRRYPFVIDENSNVGIGTIDPQVELHVKGSAFPYISIESTDTQGGNLNVTSSAGSWDMYITGADLRFYDGSADRVTFEVGGNVGIGTTSPDDHLHLEATENTTFRLTSQDDLEIEAGTEHIAKIQFEGQRLNRYDICAAIKVRQDGTWSTSTPYYSPAAIEFCTQDNTGTDALSTARMTISQSGKVGIGTSSPGSDLHISRTTAYPWIFVESTGSANGGGIELKSTASDWDMFVASTDLIIRENSSEKVRIKDTGNIGIGLGGTNPTYRLDVEGTAGAIARFVSTSTNTPPDVLIVDQDNSNTRAALRVQGNAGAINCLWVASGGNVGIGDTVAPEGLLHVKRADSGIAPSSTWNELLVEGTGNIGASIYTDAGGAAALFLGESGYSVAAAGFKWDGANDRTEIWSGGAAQVYIDNNGNVGLGAIPSTKLHIIESAGTLPTIAYDTPLIIQNNANTGDDCHIALIGGSGSGASSGIDFGHATDVDAAWIRYNPYVDKLDIRCNSFTGITIDSGGNVGIKEDSPSCALHINSSQIRIATSSTVSSSSQSGDAGTIRWDSNYIYICVATDTWKRAALSTW